jgi:peptidoglycan/LPS O-acetylase OafA/YrhL
MSLLQTKEAVIEPSLSLRQHNEKIDVLRGVAITLVFGYHALLVIFGQYEIYDFSPSGF